MRLWERGLGLPEAKGARKMGVGKTKKECRKECGRQSLHAQLSQVEAELSSTHTQGLFLSSTSILRVN